MYKKHAKNNNKWKGKMNEFSSLGLQISIFCANSQQPSFNGISIALRQHGVSCSTPVFCEQIILSMYYCNIDWTFHIFDNLLAWYSYLTFRVRKESYLLLHRICIYFVHKKKLNAATILFVYTLLNFLLAKF